MSRSQGDSSASPRQVTSVACGPCVLDQEHRAIVSPAPKAELPTIGWREYVDFPEWGIRRVRAKVDTGAKTSSVDAFDISEVADGEIEFRVVQARRPRERTKLARARVVRHTVIKNSMGQAEHRYVVRTLARVGEHEFALELTLVARPRLLCRMLIGRRALDGRFVVDCAHKYLATGTRVRRVARKSRAVSGGALKRPSTIESPHIEPQ